MRYADSDRCSCIEQYTPQHAYTFVGPCTRCRDRHSVTIPAPELYTYSQGQKHIQDAMPSVDAGGREFLMSGICPKCWDEMFADEEDEDDEETETQEGPQQR